MALGPVRYSLSGHHSLQPASNPPQSILIMSCFHSRRPKRSVLPEPGLPTTTTTTARGLVTSTDKRHITKPPSGSAVHSNVPLEITLFLSNYVAWLLKNKRIEPTVASAFIGALSALQDTVTNLDRIRNTPLPFAYQVHLRVSLWLYLFFLPVCFHLYFIGARMLIALNL